MKSQPQIVLRSRGCNGGSICTLVILRRDDRTLAQRGLRSTLTFALCSVRADRYERMAWNGGHV